MGVETGPRLKVSMLKSVLADVHKLESAQRESVLRGIGQSIIRDVEDATRTEWLPAQYILDMDQALMDTLGPERFHAYWRSFGSRATDIPLIRPLAAAAMRLFTGPGGIFKLVPKAFALTAREFGDLTATIHDDNHGVDLVYTNLPALPRLNMFALACEGSYHAPYDLLQVPGKLKLDHDRTSGGQIWLTGRW